jgi:hypothetical protein
MENTIVDIKLLRLRIDSLAQLTKSLGDPNLSRQLDLCTDKLFLGKAWLGKVLGKLNVKSPYPSDGTRKSVADIEPTAERAKEIYTPDMFANGNKVEKVDFIREEIGNVANQVLAITEGHEVYAEITKAFIMQSYLDLCEARFWMGFELERIREYN